MKKTLFILALCLITALSTHAQTVKIGYFSYDSLLHAMPDYAVVQTNIDNLRKQYADELKAAQDEFNEKYELFLDQQASLAESIRMKRQGDLQALLERNEQFGHEAERLLRQAEDDAMKPLHQKLNDAIAKAGDANGYAVIINTDSNAAPYIAPTMAEDATEAITAAMQ